MSVLYKTKYGINNKLIIVSATSEHNQWQWLYLPGDIYKNIMFKFSLLILQVNKNK